MINSTMPYAAKYSVQWFWGDGKHGTELYDYQADPDEYTNLVGKPDHAGTLALMKALMKETRARTGK